MNTGYRRPTFLDPLRTGQPEWREAESPKPSGARLVHRRASPATGATYDAMGQLMGQTKLSQGCHRYAKEGEYSGATSVRGGEEKKKGGSSVPHLPYCSHIEVLKHQKLV